MAGPEAISRATGLRALVDALPAELASLAFTHSSWTDRGEESYERLAFLGDSVLGLAVSAELYARFPKAGAGLLTKIRAQAVSGPACAAVAEALELPARLREAAPAEVGHQRAVERLLDTERTLASVCEAAIGACYLAHGYGPTAEAVVEAFAEATATAAEGPLDFKSELQERLARDGRTVEYEVILEAGPAHDRRFDVEARVGGRPLGRGSGRSKKSAEQEAAARALEALEADGGPM